MSKVIIAKDPRWISLAKSVSWRITGTIDTIIISWIITRKLTIALSIGSIELFTKMVLYYFHERLWERLKWQRDVDYEI